MKLVMKTRTTSKKLNHKMLNLMFKVSKRRISMFKVYSTSKTISQHSTKKTFQLKILKMKMESS